MKLLARDGDTLTYEARFWEAPSEVGQQGRYVVRKVCDRIVQRRREKRVLGHRLANTARNVSYYPALEKALGIKWGEV